jgi:hypothetical protein
VLTNLQHEAGETPRVVVHNNPSAMADHFDGAADCNQCRERPLLPTIALVDMNKHADAKDGDEDGVGWEVGLVLEDAPFHRTSLKVALAPTSLLRFIGRHCMLFVESFCKREVECDRVRWFGCCYYEIEGYSDVGQCC